MTLEIHQYQVGDFRCTAINDGMLTMPSLAAFYQGAPEDDLAAALKKYGLEPGEIAIPVICTLIDTGQQRILLDTGAGPEDEHGLGKLMDGLAGAGYQPGDIDLVLLSHGHWDHVGGNLDADDKIAFPSARFVMARAEWAYWAEAVDVMAYGEESKPVLQSMRDCLLAIRDRLELVEPDVEVAPGIQLVATPGHTLHHTSVVATSGDACLICSTDTMDHPLHIEHTDWHPAWDDDPQQALASRRKLLAQAADTGALVQGCHFPFPGLGRIQRDAAGFRWQSAALG